MVESVIDVKIQRPVPKMPIAHENKRLVLIPVIFVILAIKIYDVTILILLPKHFFFFKFYFQLAR